MNGPKIRIHVDAVDLENVDDFAKSAIRGLSRAMLAYADALAISLDGSCVEPHHLEPILLALVEARDILRSSRDAWTRRLGRKARKKVASSKPTAAVGAVQ